MEIDPRELIEWIVIVAIAIICTVGAMANDGDAEKVGEAPCVSTAESGSRSGTKQGDAAGTAALT